VISPKDLANIVPKGKFFSRRGQKFFFKAMRLDSIGDSLDFNAKLALGKRLEELSNGHTTALILRENQAEETVGLAARAGLHVLIELEVPTKSLLSRSGLNSLTAHLIHTVKAMRGHRAVLGYLIDCPLSRSELHEYGVNYLRGRLRKVLQTIKRTDGDRMVALKHRSATIALAQLEEEMIYAVMPALSPSELKAYLLRLHNLAEARPVVLEFGEELPGQDELVACAFGLGAAGVVAPAMRPAALPGSLGIRMLSAGELLPFVTLNGSCPPPPMEAPMVSVVICAYNAERTMRDCLASLRQLDYSNYEVIVVDDGSQDRTAEIVAEFPDFRLIRQPNKGLAVARNVGMQAARGEVVAYTDSDCVVDPHWLALMIRAMNAGDFDGCGGPNYAPHEETMLAACVAAAPGAPSHVLTGDDHAEHLAGCNMIFRKSALLKIGGFDPQFRAAGDDVDICWRLIDAGCLLGFCPSAFVWHFRRNTVGAYYGQQRGYGRAEAMLYLKYPERFNALGQVKWCGTIPGLARTVPGGSRRITNRILKPANFQIAGEAPLSILNVLPMTLEWNLIAASVLLSSLALGVTSIPVLGMLALGPIWALYYAWRAPLEKCHDRLATRLLVAALALTGPFTRTMARYRHRRISRRQPPFDAPPRQRPVVDWSHRTLRLTYWNERWTRRDKMLAHLRGFFESMGMAPRPDRGWKDFDLMVEPDSWTRIEFTGADEEHGGERLKNHVAARIRLSAVARGVLTLCAMGVIIAIGIAPPSAAAMLAVFTAGVVIVAMSEAVEAGRLAYRAIEHCATELELIPLGVPTAAARRSEAGISIATKSGSSAQPSASG
jgi:glycosyltransferase involved in cell wall biosynthesis/uncharacterized membrane protein YphA (DoxX/SURF4 family)